MNKTWLITGIINLITALIHTIMGQIEVVNPFVKVDFDAPLKAILHSCWHMVTISLFFSSIVFIYIGIYYNKNHSIRLPLVLGLHYIGFSLAFILISASYNCFLPHWILLLPIGVLAIIGCRRPKKQA